MEGLKLSNAFIDAIEKLGDKGDDGFSLVVHPNVIEYDYRISRTWEEMDKRNKSNALKDKIRLACGMPGRPYGRPLFSQWTDHWGKQHYLNKIGNFGSGKTDLIPDWR